VREKNKQNEYLIQYYEKKMFRKNRFQQYRKQQQVEEEIIKRFENTYGKKDEVLIMIGDWSEGRPMKNMEPSKGKGIREMFKRHGYQLYIVDEYRTSCRLYETEEELINLRGEHALLGSKIYTKVKDMDKPCEELKKYLEDMKIRPTIINRDLNGALNIRLKGLYNLLYNIDPPYMRRNQQYNY